MILITAGAVESYRQSKQPFDQPHAPGWARTRIYYSDPNKRYAADTTWDGHRFCEKDVHSFSDDSIYFIPWTGENADWSKSDIKAEPKTCGDDPKYGTDPIFTYDCSIAISFATIIDWQGIDPNDARIKILPPEEYAKVFHPRTNGFRSLKRMNTADMI
jgi:hypothetical protein